MAHHRPWPRQIAETDDEADDDDEVGNYGKMGDKMGDNNKVDEGNEVDDDNELDDGNEVDDDAEMDDKDHSDGPEPPRKHAKLNSTCHDAKPTQLHFYPGTWVNILEYAKQYFCLWLVNECPFAECEANLPDMQCALNQAMDEFKARDTEVEPGKPNTICSYNLIFIYCRLLLQICPCYDGFSKLLSMLMNDIDCK